MLIQDRILVILKANNLSASEFASKIGINRSNLSHVLSGRNKPSLDFLTKIITSYPNINASWLITGETREGDFAPSEEVKPANPTSTLEENTSVKTIPEGVEKIVVFYTNGTFKEYGPG
ncbi:MAG: transcriptional regulator with XRE-family HTH domain [Salibacteraceae bacterium]|jgi:transcriptional regulator with XRE-family HTH domain